MNKVLEQLRDIIKLGEWFETIIKWMKEHLDPFFDFFKDTIEFFIDHFIDGMMFIPSWLLLIIVALIAYKISGRKVAIFSFIGLFLILLMGYWEDMIITLSMVFVSTFIALLIGIPVGIYSARHDQLDRIVRPILDFMQTMPAYVYLIPAVQFFHLGEVPGVIATIIFSMPPCVRLTNLGIRQVSKEVVEAAKSFGTTKKQLLFKVQIPLAKPTILAGLNQTIMLGLSMVVISAMIGAKGLGLRVYNGITQLDIGNGFESGLAIVILAMVLDRITNSLGNDKK